ncbi:MAG: nucleoside-diphosphate kinase [bacterium]|nr:nucleoside-diphosphate kinase [bacterium]
MDTNVLKERSLVVIKPDGLRRALTGKIIQKFENVGLKLIAMKMDRPTLEQIKGHYPGNSEDVPWLSAIGEKTLKTYSDLKMDVKEKLGTSDALELGKQVRNKLIKHWQEGPVIVMIWEGPHAVEIIRKLRGVTTPLQAEPGTILGDLSFDSQVISNNQDRAMKVFVHATGATDESDREIEHWFGKNPVVFDYYQRTDHAAML